MSDDFWSDFIVGDQNFDGNVDYFDQMIVDDECKEIGHVSFGGGGRSTKKSSQAPVKDEPVIEGSPFKIFAFECFYFVACTFIMFFIFTFTSFTSKSVASFTTCLILACKFAFSSLITVFCNICNSTIIEI